MVVVAAISSSCGHTEPSVVASAGMVDTIADADEANVTKGKIMLCTTFEKLPTYACKKGLRLGILGDSLQSPWRFYSISGCPHHHIAIPTPFDPDATCIFRNRLSQQHKPQRAKPEENRGSPGPSLR